MPVALPIAAAFASGAWLAPALDLPVMIAAALAAGLAALLTMLMARRRGPRWLVLVSCALCAGLGARGCHLQQQEALIRNLEDLDAARVWHGTVLADQGTPLERRRLVLGVAFETPGGPSLARVHLGLRGEASTWPRFAPGDEVRFRARLIPPEPAWMPGQLDLRRLQLARGVVARASVHQRRQLVRIARDRSNGWEFALPALRQHLASSIDRALPAEASALTRAMVIGDRSDVDAELRAPFDGAGAAHLLAVSGLHVGSFAGLLFLLARWAARRCEWLARRVPPRRLAALCAAPAALGFSLVAGASASALRAGVMVAAVFLGAALWRERATLSALGLAALVILGQSPAAVDDPSFVLSFATVAAILYGAPRLQQLLAGAAPRDPARSRVLTVLAASLAASLISLPLSAFYFGRVAPYGLVANLVLIPMAGIALPAAISAALAGCALQALGSAGLGTLGVQLGAALVLALRDLCAAVARLPGAVWPVPSPPLIAVLLFCAGLALSLAWRRHRRAAYLGLGLLCLGAIATFVPWQRPRPGQLQAFFLPVGQGDATLLLTPAGRAVLIDTPGDPRGRRDPAAEVVLPFLQRLGLDRLHAIVVTHPDQDHYGGLARVMAQLCPTELWWNELNAQEKPWLDLLAASDRCGARHRTFDAAHPAQELDGVRFELLHPLVPSGMTPHAWPELDRNENSLVLQASFGSHRLLLTGDAGPIAEQSLLEAGRVQPLTALKCSHHGSGASTGAEFLAASRPGHALISAGYMNPFHHPAPQVLARLHEAGAVIWRTDRHGLITLRTDGRTAHVSPYRRWP